MSNGGMQPTYGPRTDNTHDTNSGNSTLTDGAECEAIQATYEGMAARSGPLSAEDDSFVQGVYKMMASDFAGS